MIIYIILIVITMCKTVRNGFTRKMVGFIQTAIERTIGLSKNGGFLPTKHRHFTNLTNRNRANIKTAMRIQLKLVSADEFIFFLKSQGKLESKQHFLGIYIVM